MEALALITRDERLRDELERLAAGRLSAEEVAALERRAGSDEELRAAIELCRPRPTEFHQELARAALATMAASGPTDRPAEPAAPTTAPSPSPPSSSPGDELAARRSASRPAIRDGRRRVLWGAAITGLAAAAAVLLVVRARPAPTAALPDYTMEVASATGLRADPGLTDPAAIDPARTEPAGPIELTAGGRLAIVLRPVVRAAAPVEAWFFARRGDEVEPLPLEVQVDPSGAVLATGEVGSWADGATLLAAIGPAGRPPSPDDARARATGWRWLTRTIAVVGPR